MNGLHTFVGSMQLGRLTAFEKTAICHYCHHGAEEGVPLSCPIKSRSPAQEIKKNYYICKNRVFCLVYMEQATKYDE